MRYFLILVFLGMALMGLGQKTLSFADSIQRAFNIPEMSYAVIDSRATLEIAALGLHSVDLPDSASLDDRFHLASNTKALTAFVIAKYVEKGKLSWTTRFFEVFPEWKAGSEPAYAEITLQDLLSHRGGIQSFRGENDPEIPSFSGTPQAMRMQFGQFVLTLPPSFPDEENPFVYSNAGYTLAALMVERVTGKSWEQLVKKVLNKDLHLAAQFSWPENQKRRDTWGHSDENGKWVPVPSDADFRLDYTEPAGDLNMKLTDYIRFVQLNLKGLAGEDSYLKAETVQFLLKGIENYSLGWYNIYENGGEWSTHAGTVGTYYTLVHIDRIHQKAYIVFTNCYNPEITQGVRLLMRKLKENYPG